MTQPMTLDDMLAVYRAEMDASALTPVRRDLYQAMADADVDAGNKRQADRLRREITRIRATKVCNMAFLGALGTKHDLSALTDEERGYCLASECMAKTHLRECGHPVGDAPEPDSAPRYDPARPTDEDVAKVREAMTGLWSTVVSLASRTGLEQYVVRRACQALTASGDAVHKETANGIQTYRKASRQVQQTLPASSSPCRDEGLPHWVRTKALGILADGGWHGTQSIITRAGIEGDGRRPAKTVLRNAMQTLVDTGQVERYPPTVKDRHFKGDIQYRLAKKEASA